MDIADKVKLEYYKLQKDFQGEIILVAENEEGGELKHPEEFNTNVKPVEERNSLEEIIHLQQAAESKLSINHNSKCQSL
ncbi:hypothetical protein [Pseudogracilibacillus sp. SO30301A]|uniref:hypothetical protein n=1 Tax=Pseudogracilibacillus sp. SO30301A TaxID=3098291 RepID=UPI00300DDA35